MLKRLDLLGFKTFASRTVLELDPGITAIVGPNGSGKSNLAEAVRWVLGEQSARALRSRRTEDVIFAGGPRRPPAGLAEVVVTLDNQAGRLALPFVEVSVARRAYRSGESEYLLNRERARLRDVTDLLSRAGLGPGAHVVVGQGLVDAALSLRPEERRTLFEEAAAIGHHQARLAEARERLAQTQQNLARVVDVVAEIAPRLPVLARQAERARQALTLRAELEEALADLFSHLWRESRRRAAALAAEGDELAAELSAATAALAGLEAQAAAAGASRAALADELAELRRRADELRQAREALRRELAAGRERLRGLAARSQETARDLAELEAARDAESAALAAGAAALAALRERLGQLAAELAGDAAGSAEQQARRRELQACEAAARSAAAAARDRLAEARAGDRALARRRQEVAERLAELRRGEPEATSASTRVEARRQELEDEQRRLLAEQESLAAESGAAQEALLAARSRQQALAAEVAELEAQARQLEARQAMLASWRDSQAGYYPGVRAVLQASRRPGAGHGERALGGIVGTVGELVQAPPRYETAIEVALGAHLQDVVVQRWEDAEVAVEHLKASGAGRATFLPLDTLRAGPPGRPPADGSGVHGVASRLVSVEPAYAVVVEHLLGHTLVVDDLTVARRALRQVSGGWQLVTLGGEIVRASGAITGGSGGGPGRGVLGRERELRRLPGEAAAVAARLTAARESQAGSRSAEQQAAGLIARLRRREQENAAARRAQDAALLAHRREEAGQEQGRRWREAEERRLAGEEVRLAREAAELAAALTRAEAEAVAAQAASERSAAELVAADEADRQAALLLAERRAARAAAEQEAKGLEQAQARREAACARAAEQAAQRAARLAELRRSADEAGARVREGERGLVEVEAELGRLGAELRPRQAELAELEEALRSLETAQQAARTRLQAAREREQHASLALERQRGEAAALLRQVELELGPAEEAAGLLRVQVGAAAVTLDRQPADAEKLPARVQDLRRRLRGLGATSPEAVEEHEQARARHTYLTGQVQDLERAATALREASAELEEEMRRRFLTTFAAAAAAFQRNFARLFGGGSGTLTLTSPESPEAGGVEVIAQLPGKRAQGLGQLSGGERALTAVALLLALLEANPLPFCVLDEVDAALDEANVGRFTELLRERAALTQFVVITHNRRTMEAAQALYGLSLEDRSVSRVFSIRLAGA